MSRDFRPLSLENYVGQKNLKEKLNILMESANIRDSALDHMLFHGPPGLGKTSISRIVANSMGVQLKQSSAPIIDKTGDIAAILMSLNEKDILFIDEIHRLRKPVEEMLYSAMEDGFIDIMIGKGPTAKSVRIKLKKFTLIGATTKLSLLAAPLRDRFGFIHRLEHYSDSELIKLLQQNCSSIGISISDDAAKQIANISRGTPRVANKFLRRAIDLAHVNNTDNISINIVNKMRKLMGVDSLGLEPLDIKILKLMASRFSGGPVGIETLAISLGEDRKTLENINEAYLVKLGMIERTNRGRVLTKSGYEHVSLFPKNSSSN